MFETNAFTKRRWYKISLKSFLIGLKGVLIGKSTWACILTQKPRNSIKFLDEKPIIMQQKFWLTDVVSKKPYYYCDRNKFLINDRFAPIRKLRIKNNSALYPHLGATFIIRQLSGWLFWGSKILSLLKSGLRHKVD